MKKIFKVCMPLLGASVLLGVAVLVLNALELLEALPPEGRVLNWISFGAYAVAIICGLILGYLLFPAVERLYTRLEGRVRAMPISDLLAGAAGLAFGLMLAFFLSNLVNMIHFAWLRISISVLLYTVLGAGCMRFAMLRRKEIAEQERPEAAQASQGRTKKLLDTSVIIDGRIYDICQTGFLEGDLIVPTFVLRELRTISDSEDDLKRTRGRRGLDVLARLQKELHRPVTVEEWDSGEHDVDAALLNMAQEIDAIIITNDFNLNKVAKVQNIPVLNINDLANAVKPVAIPGDVMQVRVIKEGKEARQGIAYLDDGTMIVVENGQNHIGEEISITVTSALQTSAGRMIFGRPCMP